MFSVGRVCCVQVYVCMCVCFWIYFIVQKREKHARLCSAWRRLVGPQRSRGLDVWVYVAGAGVVEGRVCVLDEGTGGG